MDWGGREKRTCVLNNLTLGVESRKNPPRPLKIRSRSVVGKLHPPLIAVCVGGVSDVHQAPSFMTRSIVVIARLARRSPTR